MWTNEIEIYVAVENSDELNVFLYYISTSVLV